MAPIQMTRAQYDAKYGQHAASSTQPVQMTREQYNKKYNQQNTVLPQSQVNKSTSYADLIPHSKYNESYTGMGNILKAVGNIPHEVGTAVENVVKVPIEAYKTITDQSVRQHPVEAVKGGVKSAYESLISPVVQGLSTTGNTFLGMLQWGIKSAAGVDMGDKKAEEAFRNVIPNIYDTTQNLQRGLVENPLATAGMFAEGVRQVSGKPVGTDGISMTARPVIDTASKATGPIVKKLEPVLPDLITKDVATLRANKIKQGFEEQNTRLKTAEKSFNENTRTYTQVDGNKVKVTPIDTFGKHNITPEVTKGTLQMGDYGQGTGALGKIREVVSSLDDDITSRIKDNGKGVSLQDFKLKTIKEITDDADIKRSGKVEQTVAKLDSVFDDYARSYGDTLDELEINEIRKVMNKDWNPDTMDVSKAVGNAARDVVYNVTDDMVVKSLLQEQSNLMAAKKYAEKINNTKVVGGRLGNMALRTTGAVVGTGINVPVVGPIVGAIGGEYLSRALQQSQFKSLGTETKALFQSNKQAQTANAITTPSNSIIPKTLPSSVQKGTPLSTAARQGAQTSSSLPKSVTQKAKDWYKSSGLSDERGMINPSAMADDMKGGTTASIRKAKAEGKTFDEWVKGQGTPVYHGTSLENANNIKAEGFKVGRGRGVSGRSSDDFVYATGSKQGANRYVSDRLGIKNPTVVDAGFVGKTLEIQGKMADFEAFGEASKKIGIPLGIDSQGTHTMLDMPAIKKAMQEQGYGAISFSDRFANGSKAYAILPDNLKTRSQLRAEWDAVSPKSAVPSTARKVYDAITGKDIPNKEGGFIATGRQKKYPDPKEVAKNMDGEDFVTLEKYLDELNSGERIPMNVVARAEALLDTMKFDARLPTDQMKDWIRRVLAQKEAGMRRVPVKSV